MTTHSKYIEYRIQKAQDKLDAAGKIGDLITIQHEGLEEPHEFIIHSAVGFDDDESTVYAFVQPIDQETFYDWIEEDGTMKMFNIDEEDFIILPVKPSADCTANKEISIKEATEQLICLIFNPENLLDNDVFLRYFRSTTPRMLKILAELHFIKNGKVPGDTALWDKVREGLINLERKGTYE